MMHLLMLPPKLVLNKVTKKYRRKSHKVAFGPLCPNEDEVLAAMRAALRNPVAMTESETVEFETFRSQANVAVYRPEPREVNGQVVYRREGESGTHLPMRPAEWDLRQLLAAQRVAMSKFNRKPPDPKLAAQARDAKAKARAAPVLVALEKYRSLKSKCGAAVADATGETIEYVRSVRLKNARDAHRQFS